MEAQGMLFDIQHFSLQDGPGVRATVFFKGCPLRCKWCSNPESQSASPQMLYYEHLCTRCGKCAETCPAHAIFFDGQGRVRRTKACVTCGKCTEVCPHGATVKSGYVATVGEICSIVDEDWRIMTQSGGGVTVSGGEPLAQPEFLRHLLKAVRQDCGFHTCIETTAFAPWQDIENIIPYLDMMFVDLKNMVPLHHRAGTGQDNALILQNVSRLARTGVPITIRIPLIPQYNDSPYNIEMMCSFMNDSGLRELEIMPQHSFGKSKYAALGREYQIREDIKPRIDEAVEIAKRFHVDVMVHGRD